MSVSPHSEHEVRLLTEVLAGDRGKDDPDVVAAASRNAEFRASLDQLESVQGRLDIVGRSEQELIAQAQSADDGAMDDVVAETIERLAGGQDRQTEGSGTVRAGRRSPLLMWSMVGAAAAALLVIWALGGFGAEERNDDYDQLGDPELKLRVDAEETVYVLSWTCSEPASSYRVSFYHPFQPGLRLPVSEKLETTEWKIDRVQAEAMPDGVRWRVTALVGGREIKANARLR